MRIYRLWWDANNFRGLQCSETATSYLVDHVFQGMPMVDEWEPFDVWWEQESGLPMGDFPLFSEVVVTKKVVDAVGDRLERYGELLTLRSRDGEFFVYNVTNVIDALDESESVGRRFTPGGRYMWINKHVFNEAAIGRNEVFKIPQLLRGSYIYFTDSLWRRIQDADLRGLVPTEVWSTEEGPRWLPLLGIGESQ